MLEMWWKNGREGIAEVVEKKEGERMEGKELQKWWKKRKYGRSFLNSVRKTTKACLCKNESLIMLQFSAQLLHSNGSHFRTPPLSTRLSNRLTMQLQKLLSALNHTPQKTIETQPAKASTESPQNVSSEPGISIEVKEERIQMAEAPSQSFPTSTVHIVPHEEFEVKDVNIKPMPGISENETNNARIQAERHEGPLEEKGTSSPQFFSGMYKNQLQEFAAWGGFELPCYSHIREGPPHAPRFNATVEFNGATFKSPGFFNTLREAEQACAAVVLKSLSEKGSSLGESCMYKNFLHRKAQKERRPSPVYITIQSGPLYAPIFTCTVMFDDMTFVGKDSKKKQAEKNAALAAWSALKDVRRSVASKPLMPEYEVKEPAYEPNCHSNVGVKNQMKKRCEVN